jgi:hypothetical protein
LKFGRETGPAVSLIVSTRTFHGDRIERPGGIDQEEWFAREAVLQRFDQAWRRGPRPVLEEWLPIDQSARRALLLEMVQTDMEYRLKEGEPARVEDYLDRFSELRSDPEA